METLNNGTMEIYQLIHIYTRELFGKRVFLFDLGSNFVENEVEVVIVFA